MSKIFPINALIDKLFDFLKLKGDQIKLDVMGRLAKILASVIALFLISIIGFLFIFFLGVSLAVYLNEILDSSFMGHLIVSGLLLLKLIILLLFLKTGKIQGWLEQIILSIAEDEDESTL